MLSILIIVVTEMFELFGKSNFPKKPHISKDFPSLSKIIYIILKPNKHNKISVNNFRETTDPESPLQLRLSKQIEFNELVPQFHKYIYT